MKLQTLVDIASLGSIASAAQRSGISASAASQQITTLERELGVDLLERRARSVRLTSAGSELARAAVGVLAGLGDAARVAQDVGGLRAGTLRVGSFASAVPEVVAPAVARFLRVHTGVGIELMEIEPEYTAAAIVDARLDVAVTNHYPFAADYPMRGMKRVELYCEPLLLSVPVTHRLAHETSVRLADVATEPWIAPIPTEGFQALVEYLAKRAGFVPNIRHRCDTVEMTRALVATGLGVAVVPRTAALVTAGVRYLNIDEEAVERRVDVIHRANDRNPALAEFVGMLAERTPRF